VAHQLDAVAVARRACVDFAVGGARALAPLADLLLVPLELGSAAVVEVAQRDFDLEVHVGAAPLLLVEVAAATEEAAEDVERVVPLLPAALLLVLLEALVAVLVVDAPALAVDEGFVSFGDLDELVVGSLVIAWGRLEEGWW